MNIIYTMLSVVILVFLMTRIYHVWLSLLLLDIGTTKLTSRLVLVLLLNIQDIVYIHHHILYKKNIMNHSLP
ncbi:hypothetical protein ES705_43576 [subsurface metagenome]